MNKMQEFVNLKIDNKFIEESITQEVFIQSGHKTTICLLILNTGHEIVGTFTSTAAPSDIKEGKDKSREEALIKVEEYFIQLNSWRFAIYTAEKRYFEQQEAAEKANQQGPEGTAAEDIEVEELTPKKKRVMKKS